MKGLSESDDHQQLPFIATRGYDSVVWNRLYSRDIGDLEDHQIDQVRRIKFHGPSYVILSLLRSPITTQVLTVYKFNFFLALHKHIIFSKDW